MGASTDSASGPAMKTCLISKRGLVLVEPVARKLASPLEPNAALGIGSEGETGAFKCLTLSTLAPPPTRGLSLRAVWHTTARPLTWIDFIWWAQTDLAVLNKPALADL